MSKDDQQRPAIYARYSSHNQDDGTSIEVQLRACRELAGEDALEYVDRATTGTTMERDGFQRMIADAEAGQITTLYVYKFDRFGRSAHAHGIVADLEQLGVRVVSATEGGDPLSRGIQLVVAEDFSRRQSQRIRDAKEQAWREGRWHGGPVPYGYRPDGNRLVVDEEESDWIQELFERYRDENIGFKSLARWLENGGIQPRKARHWTGDSVKAILRNPMYAGRVYHGVFREQTQRSRAHADRAYREYRQDESLRVVPDELWQAVQTKIEKRRNNKPAGRARSRAFTKVLQCATCGGSCVRRYYRSGKNYRPEDGAYWACGTRVKVGKDRCSNDARVDERAAIENLTDAMHEIFANQEQAISDALDELRRQTESGRAEADRVKAKIADLDRRLKHAAELLTDPDVASDRATKQQLSQQISELSAEKERLQGEYERLARDSYESVDRAEAAIRQAMAEAEESLQNVATDAQLNDLIRNHLGVLELQPDGTITVPGSPEGITLRRCPASSRRWRARRRWRPPASIPPPGSCRAAGRC